MISISNLLCHLFRFYLFLLTKPRDYLEGYYKQMYKYLLEQEQLLLNGLETGFNLERLYEYSRVQIAWISHERLVHLLVTLFISLLLIVSFFGFIPLQNKLIALLFAILTVLILFYIVHYYRLENGIHRLYKLSNQIHHKISQ